MPENVTISRIALEDFRLTMEAVVARLEAGKAEEALSYAKAAVERFKRNERNA